MSIKSNITLLVLAVILLVGFPVSSFAGNPGNSSEGGNVTSIVVCEADEDDSEPIPITVEGASVAISADGCSCEIMNPGDPLDCENTGEDESPCAVCLATLQRAGLSIISVNSYEELNGDEDEQITIHHYNLTGNAGPFLDRTGGCPCIPD